MKMLLRVLILLLAGMAPAAAPAEAQIWKKVKKAAKESAERAVVRETEEKTEQAVRDAIDGAENAIVCAVTDQACIEEAEASGQDVVVTDAEGNVVERREASGASASGAGSETATEAMAPGEGAWANYDFVPGERVLFYDDYENTYPGNVPGRLRFVNGTMEVVEQDGSRLLRFTNESRFAIELPETLPERFTIEFEAYVPYYSTLALSTGPLDEGRDEQSFGPDQWANAYFSIGSGFHAKVGLYGGAGGSTNGQYYEPLNKRMVPVRISVDGSYVKMYLDEGRVVNVPNADLGRLNEVTFVVGGWVGREEANWVYVDDVRVAAGGRQVIYDKLQAEGKATTRGILFDTGSAAIRPESTPTLEDIGRMLEQHADLRLKIEGHTDNAGSAATNKSLSQLRAEAVKLYLEQEHGVDAARLEAVGMGQEQPAAPNDTPEGQQSNRRVELVRL